MVNTDTAQEISVSINALFSLFVHLSLFIIKDTAKRINCNTFNDENSCNWLYFISRVDSNVFTRKASYQIYVCMLW